MFSNFKDAFIKKPQYTSEPPQAVLDTISKELPEGFYYVHDHDGICRIETPEGFNVESGKMLLSDNAKKALPENPTVEDVIAYSYNSQSDIVFMPDEDGCFMVNGNKIKATDIVKAPLRNIQFEKASFLLKPDPFPEPFKLKIGYSEYWIELLVQRIPNNSIHEQEYESVSDVAISIRYKLSLASREKFTFTININIEKAKNASDISKAYHIYNAFMNGEGMIENSKLISEKLPSTKSISKDTIEFWDKVVSIEKYLNVQFDVSNGITVSDARTVEELYRCFIEKKPYRNYKIYNSVKGTGKFEQFGDALNDIEIYFEYIADATIELLGVKISVKALFVIFDAVIDRKVSPENGKIGEFEIFLKTAPEKKMYESVLLFTSNEQLNSFRGLPDYIKEMENATEVNSIE